MAQVKYIDREHWGALGSIGEHWGASINTKIKFNYGIKKDKYTIS